MLNVYIINEKGIYQLVAEGVNDCLAKVLKKKYTTSGVWCQISRTGKNNINGGAAR